MQFHLLKQGSQTYDPPATCTKSANFVRREKWKFAINFFKKNILIKHKTLKPSPGVSNSEWLAGRMRLKESSCGPHLKKWKKLPINFQLKTKNTPNWKNRQIVYELKKNCRIFRCSWAALDPLGGRVFETADLVVTSG